MFFDYVLSESSVFKAYNYKGDNGSAREFSPLLMQKKEDQAFLNYTTAAKHSPGLLRQLRKTLAASKEKRVVSYKEGMWSCKSAYT